VRQGPLDYIDSSRIRSFLEFGHEMKSLVNLICGVTVLLGFVNFSILSSASAKDLDLLVRLLVPAYMAQNFVAICVTEDPQFPRELDNGIASVSAFAEHVKNEVTADLAETDAATVRITAADTARQVARHELDLLRGDQSEVPADALRRWCDRSVKHYIFEITSKHQEKHQEFEILLEKAKQ